MPQALCLSADVYSRFSSNEQLDQATKYRIWKLILAALLQKSRTFYMTKAQFHEMIETSSRRTQKDFLGTLQNEGIIEVLKEDHFQIHFEVRQDLFLPNQPMEKSEKLPLKYEDPDAYKIGVDGKHMPPRQEATAEKYHELISELLSDVASPETLEKISKTPSLRNAYIDRIKVLRTKIKAYEKRNDTQLPTAHVNLASIDKLLGMVKVFDAATNTYESLKADNKISMTPTEVVSYFYFQLSRKLKTTLTCSAWPSEIKASKDILRQLADRPAEFIKNYIDWVVRQDGILNLHYGRYQIPQYLQLLADHEEWGPLLANWKSKYTTAPAPTAIVEDKHLVCYYSQLYTKVFEVEYKPVNSFAKDMTRLSTLKGYLGDDLAKTARYLHWVFLSVLAVRKIKPGQPGDLYRFLSEFNDIPVIPEPIVMTQAQKDQAKIEMMLKRAAKRSNRFYLDEAEARSISNAIVNIQFTQLSDESRRIIETNPDIFTISGDSILLRMA